MFTKPVLKRIVILGAAILFATFVVTVFMLPKIYDCAGLNSCNDSEIQKINQIADINKYVQIVTVLLVAGSGYFYTKKN